MNIDFLLISVILNICLFLPAYFYKTDKLTDMSYSLTFIILSSKGFLNSDFSLMSCLLFFMHIVWALRLGIYLVKRIHLIKKDNRFNKMRDNKYSFLGFWLLQAITVYIVMLPAIFFWHNHNHVFHFTTIIGIIIWLLGFLIETIADYQKSIFFKFHDHQKQWIDTGLWYYSRHPNYFGEILVWIGVYVFCIYYFSNLELLLGFMSPLFISFLLIFVSGIPLLEKSAEKKFGHLLAYQQYKSTTSKLILLPKKNHNL